MKLYSVLMLMHFQRKLHLNAPYLSLIKIHRSLKTLLLHNEGSNAEMALEKMTRNTFFPPAVCLP